MKILAVDSSAVCASAALVEDGKIIGEFYLNSGLTHSRTLMPLIASVLECAEAKLDDVDFFAVTNGPGSFTGVRIGVAAVKGLAAPSGKKCIGVSTLLSMAYNIVGRDCVICCVMDARRSQVYAALFRSSGGAVERLSEDFVVSIEDLGKKLCGYDEEIVFVGDGALLCRNALSGVLKDAQAAPESRRFQRATGAAAAVFDRKLYENAVSPDALDVKYLRLSQAERELKAKENSK